MVLLPICHLSEKSLRFYFVICITIRIQNITHMVLFSYNNFIMEYYNVKYALILLLMLIYSLNESLDNINLSI
jgi:hypothetical protein